MDSSEPNLTRTVYLVIRILLEKGVFSPHPENVMIERVGNKDVYPCGRSYGAEGLDLSQLEWAAKEGHFWFNGPIKAIKIIIDKGLIQGDLRLELDRMLFETSLNTLNYHDFEAVANKLREVAQQLGLKLAFQQPTATYNVTLVVSSEKSLSAENVSDFIKKIHILHRSTDTE
jgi:hypothetical protein